VVKPKRKSWGGVPGIALAAFFCLVGFSALLAVQAGRSSLTEAFNFARPLGMLAFFYIVVRLFPEPAERRILMTGTAILAAITGVVAAAVSFHALSGTSFQEAGGSSVRTQEGLGNVERVRLAGLSAGYALFWFSAVQVALRKGPKRAGWLLLLAGITLDIIVSFNRNMWIGIVLGAVLMAVIGGTMVRNRMATGLAVVVAGLAIFVFFGTSSKSTVVEPILQRGETILNPGKTTQESSLQERGNETTEAWGVAKDNLVFGVGAGAPFDVFIEKNVTSGTLLFGTEEVEQLFLHNQYLYLILICGVPGLIAFLVFLLNPIVAAMRRQPRDPAIAACGVGILLIMISAVVAIYFTVEDMTAILGLLTGVIAADRETRALDGQRSEMVT
jgi:O-antigen ligase